MKNIFFNWDLITIKKALQSIKILYVTRKQQPLSYYRKGVISIFLLIMSLFFSSNYTVNAQDCGYNLSGLMYLGEYNGQEYYKNPNGDVGWTQANTEAMQRGGRLAMIKDAATNSFFQTIITPGDRVWLGLTDVVSEGNFKWQDGSNLTFADWEPGEPNNFGNEDYVWFTTGGWNDAVDYGNVNAWRVFCFPVCNPCDPNVNASNNGFLTCTNNEVQLSVSGSGAIGASYSWTGPNGFSSNQQNPIVAQSGTYIVTVTKNGCTAQASTTVTSNTDAPTATASANDEVLDCETGTIDLLGNSNMTNVSYSWTGPNGYGSNQQSPTVNAAGTYTLTVTKNDTGCEATDQIIVEEGNCIYDLSLIKTLAPNQSFLVEVGAVVNFIVKVTNQGQMNSEEFTVMDRLPYGMTFVSADNGGIHNNSVITWELDNLAEGDFIELSIAATVDELGTGLYRNWAEISSDSGDDEDSTPDANTGNGFTDPNDLVDNHNDMMLDNSLIDEDDNDFEDVFVSRGIELSSRVLLQGAMLDNETDYMRADLNEDDLIPTSEPYSSMSNFEHVGQGGGEIVMEGVFDVVGENAIVDWVLVELRDEDNPAIVLETASGLLQADGDIVATDGVSSIAFPSLEADYYQVCVRHRNHLGVMTQNAVYISDEGEPVSVDFTSPTTATYGSFAQSELTNERMAMWAGAANGTGNIAFQGQGNGLSEVFFSVLEDPNNTGSDIGYISTGYYNGDIDMDCNAIYQGTANDPNCIFFNILSHPANISNLPNFIIQSTLPE